MKPARLAAAVFGYMWECIEANEELPTLSEIAEALDLTPEDIMQALESLRGGCDDMLPISFLPDNDVDWLLS